MKKHLSLLMLLAALCLPWASNAQVSLPYSTGFETGDDASWTFVNDATNKWHIGAGAHNTGSQGLYISNNNGTSNAYTNSSTQFSYVYRDFTVTAAGQVEIAFDWKANGEGNYDYLRAWLAPTTATLTAAQDPEGGTSAYNYRESTPSGWIDLGGKMNLQTSWQTTVSAVNLTPGNYRLVFMWANDGSGGTTPPAAIDNVSINMLTCPMPSNIEVASLTAYDATISWQYPDNTASSFNFYYSTSPDFTLDTCPYETVYDTSVTLTNLTPMTTYYYVIQADCGGGDSSRVTAKQHFTTQVDCGQGFANIVDAVSYGTSSAYTQFAYNYNSSSYTVGHAGMIFTAEEMLALGLEGPATINSIKFRAGATPTSVPLRIYVGKTALTEFGSSATDTVGMMSHMTLAFNGTLQTTANEWVTIPLDTLVPYTPDSSLIVYIYRTALPTGNGTFYYTSTSPTYRAFYGYNSSATGRPSYTRTYSRNDIEFDFCYELPTCPRPTNLTYVSADPTSLTLSWNDNTGESYSSYVVDYRQVGSSVWNSVDVYDTTVTLTGLNSAHRYEVRVRAYCGGTDTSMAISGTYLTPCVDLTLDDLPYMENFDNMTGSTATSPVPAGYLPPCYDIFNHGTRTNYQYCPYVYENSTYAHSGSNSIRFYTYNSSGDSTQYLILPPIDSTSVQLNELQVSFWLRGNSTSSNYFNNVIVGVMTNPTIEASFIPVDTILSATTTYGYHEVSFDQYTGPHGRITLKFPKPTSSSQYEYGYVDDLTVREIPTCFWPSVVEVESVGQDGATIVWTPDSRTPNPSGWVVEYGPHGFTRGEGTLDNVYDTVITLTNLDANTLYDIYISADCGGDVSDPAVFSFRTACGALTTLPFTENFDGVTGSTTTSNVLNNLPPCWNYYNDGTRASYQGCPYVYNSTTYAHSGSNCIRFYSYAASGDSSQYLILPPVDSTLYPVNTLNVNFWMRAYSTSSTYHADVVVGVMTNPTDESSFVPVSTVHSSSTTYAHYSVNLGQYTGAHGCVALKFPVPTASSNYEYGYVDDVTLEVAPTCAPVVSHHVSATVGAASISWTPDPTFASAPDSYEVSYGFAADSLVGATTVTTTDLQLTLTGLTADTTYRVSIQPICTDGTAPAHVFNFNTGILPCLEWDTTGGVASGPTDTLTVGTPGTSTTNVMPVNTGYNYSYCQHLILASEVATTGPATFSGIAFDYAYSSPMTHANNCQIYMGNTTRENFTVASGSSADSMFVPYSQLTLVYQGPLNCTTTGYNYFDFNQGVFAYDGTSNIVVAIVNNSGSTNSSAIFRYQQTSASMSHRVYNNTTPFGPTEMDAARAGQSFWRSNMKLLTGGGECLTLASCAAPAVSLEQNADGDIVLSWIPGYQETSWDLDYRVATDSNWINVLAGTTLMSHTFSLSDLQPNTQYMFRVSPNCSDTVVSATARFTTPCGLFNVPFSESFDTWSSTAADPLPSCWDKHTNYTTNYPYASTSYHHSGTKAMYMYSTNTTYSYMVLPQFNLPIDSTVVSFWLYKSNTSYTHALEVGVMTDPEDVSTFVTVASVAASAVSTWEPFEVPLNNYTGTGRYIAIKSPDGVYSYPYLDDLQVDRISSCPRVENVTVYNIMQNTATVAWDADSTGGDYVVEYGPAGFTPGTGTVVNVSNVDSLDITGLIASSPYDVYVRAICTSDTSSWSRIATFYTACDVISVLPYVEDFESYASGSSNSINPCWTKGTSSTTAYPYPYSSNAVTGARSLYFYGYHPSSSTTTPVYSYAALPQFQQPINNLGMDFKVRTYTSTSVYYNTVLYVGVMTNPNDITTFTAVDTIDLSGAAAGSVHEVSVSFANYTGNGLHMAIYDPVPALVGSNTYGYSYAYVDDIVVDVLPRCPRVENLTVSPLLTTATVYWADTSSTNSAWKVEYDTVAFAPGTGHMTPIVVTDTFCTITGLDSGTFYYVYVYPDCDTDAFSRFTTFTTLAASPATVPFFCDFEAAGVNSWDLINGTQGNYWIVGSATANGGTRSMYITDDGSSNNYSGAASYVFATRTFDLVDTGNYICTFDWKAQGESSYDFIRAALVPAGVQFTAGDYSGFDNTSAVPAGGIALDGADRLNLNGSTWQTKLTEFSITTPGTYTLVFLWRNDPSVYGQPPAAIDNVGLQLNSCPSVSNIVVSSVTDVSATLQWTPGGSENQWEVTVDNHTQLVSTPAAIITGLTAMTSYTALVRPVCSVGDTGFAVSVMFTTEMCGNPNITATGDPDSTTTTTYYIPVNNFYNYTLSETIIDSAELGGPMAISAIAYYYNYATPMTAKNSVNIYLQPTNKTAFSSTSDIVALSSDAVLVYSGPLNCTQGWNTFGFNTPYQYSGNGNLLVIVDDNSGDYDASSYNFKTQATTEYKSIVYYSDSYDPDVTTVSSSYGGTKYYYQWRPVMQLISCGDVAYCPAPSVDTVLTGETSAIVSWSGSAANYEVAAVAGTWNDPASGTPVAGNTYTFTGLTPGTQYALGVRAVCSEGIYSDWTVNMITTAEHPCLAPTAVNVTGITISGATVGWTAAEADQTNFQIRYSAAADTTVVDVTTNPYTLTGLLPNTEYSVVVRAVCGEGFYSDWTAAQPFTTASCQPVTGVTVSELTQTSAKVSWTAGSNSNGNYEMAYGIIGTSVQNATRQTVAGSTNYTITGLEEGTGYVVYVRSICAEGVQSDWTSGTTFTTEDEIGIADVDNARISLYPNPASSTVTLTGIEGAATVTVVDMNGREVYSGNAADGRLTIDVSGMSQGAYFVRITGEQVNAIRKLIVR